MFTALSIAIAIAFVGFIVAGFSMDEKHATIAFVITAGAIYTIAFITLVMMTGIGAR